MKNSMAPKHRDELIEAMKELKLREQTLKEVNKAKDRMFSIIAHDLRGSVGNIRSSLKLLLNDHELKLSQKEKQEFLETIYNSAENSFELLENLLVWARNQSYMQDCNWEVVELSELIKSNIDGVVQLANIKDIHLVVTSNERVEVYVDQNMIMAVIRNLVSNAIKFTNRGGRAEIKTDIEEDTVTVSVIDNGIGIRPDQIKNIYVGRTTDGTSNEKGSGLGLILCRDLLEKHGSELVVESELNKGSCFSFSLPRISNLSGYYEELMQQEALILSAND